VQLINYTLSINICVLYAFYHIRHSIPERSTVFAPISHLVSTPCSERAAASTITSRILIRNIFKEKELNMHIIIASGISLPKDQ
jgi:hypothetical protein